MRTLGKFVRFGGCAILLTVLVIVLLVVGFAVYKVTGGERPLMSLVGSAKITPPAMATLRPTFTPAYVVELATTTSAVATPTLFTGVGVDHIDAFFLTDPDGTYCAAMGRLDAWQGPSPRECLVEQDPSRVVSDDGGILILRAEANAAPLVWIGWPDTSPDTAIFWATTRMAKNPKDWLDSAYARTADGTIFAVLGHNTKRCVNDDRCAVAIPRQIANKLVVAFAMRESEVQLLTPAEWEKKLAPAVKPVTKKASPVVKPTPTLNVSAVKPVANIAVPPTEWDVRLTERCASLTEVGAVGHWHLERADWFAERDGYDRGTRRPLPRFDSGGRVQNNVVSIEGLHNIWVDAVRGGQSVKGIPIHFSWRDGSSDVMTEKVEELGAANYAMSNVAPSYCAKVATDQSDEVCGMGLGDLERPSYGIHTNYRLVFVWVSGSPAPVQMAAAPVAPAQQVVAQAPVAVGGDLTATRANPVRPGPKSEGGQICRIHKGDQARKLGVEGSWFQIQGVGGECSGKVGYVGEATFQ